MTRSSLLAVLIALTLSACTTVAGNIAGQIPSVSSCQHVQYVRDYSVVDVHMQCDVLKSGTVQ